jgi:hypothetical protein
MLRRFDRDVASAIADKVTGLYLKGVPLYAGVGGGSRYGFDPSVWASSPATVWPTASPRSSSCAPDTV